MTTLALVFFKSSINFRSEKNVTDDSFDDLSEENYQLLYFF